MKIIGTIIAGLALIVAGVLFFQKPGAVPARDLAPSFSLTDYDGNTVALSDFQDREAVVLNSWAVWCPFCKKELADFARLQETFGERIAVVAIDRRESLKTAKDFTDSIGVTDKMFFLLDPDDSFYQSIGGFSMPETIFVDGNGGIVFHKRGPMEFDEMREKVEAILMETEN